MGSCAPAPAGVVLYYMWCHEEVDFRGSGQTRNAGGDERDEC